MSNVIHCIAWCEVCKWTEQKHLIARKAAYQHTKRTGHATGGEQATSFKYRSQTNREKGTK